MIIVTICWLYVGLAPPRPGGYSTSTLGGAVGEPGVFKSRSVTRKFLSVTCTNMQFLTHSQHIITKFSSKRLNYTGGASGWEDRPLTGGTWPLFSPPFRTVPDSAKDCVKLWYLPGGRLSDCSVVCCTCTVRQLRFCFSLSILCVYCLLLALCLAKTLAVKSNSKVTFLYRV